MEHKRDEEGGVVGLYYKEIVRGAWWSAREQIGESAARGVKCMEGKVVVGVERKEM